MAIINMQEERIFKYVSAKAILKKEIRLHE